MRPITLTMSAFGPYAQTVFLDFSLLGEQNIFVITGPTGAGKTTIFDAICYGLYGLTSGGERSTKGLRSDFVTVDERIITQVTFVFMVRGKIYGVKRQPEQRLPSKRGGGWKEGGHEAELYCIDHDEFAPLSKVSEVNAKIVEILGLDATQFKRIVMIPQGDFRQFLSANSADKQEILRKLFGTYFFERVQKALNTQAKELEQKHKEASYMLEADLKRLDCAEHQALSEAIEAQAKLEDILRLLRDSLTHDRNQASECVTLAEGLTKKQQILQGELTAGQVLNEQFAKYTQAQVNDQRLVAAAPIYDEKEKMLSLAIKAQQIEPLAEQHGRLETRLGNERTQLAVLEKQWQSKDQEKEAITQELQQLKAQSPAQEQLQKQLTQLEGYAPDVLQLVETQKQAANLERQVHQQEKLQSKLKNDLLGYKVEEQSLLLAIKALDGQRLRLLQLEQEIHNEEEKRVALRKLHTTLSQYSKATKELLMQNGHCQVEEKACQEVNELLKAKRSLQLANYSIYLANQLVEGEPCPVCGAKNHPGFCHDEAGEVVSQEAISALEGDVQEKQMSWQNAQAKRDKLQGQVDALKEMIEPETTQAEDLSEAGLKAWLARVLGEGKILAQHIDKATEEMKIIKEALDKEEETQVAYAQVLGLIEQGTLAGEAAQNEALLLAQQQAKIGADLEGILQRVPVAYHTTKALEKACGLLREELAAFKALLIEVQQRYDIIHGEVASLAGQVLMAKQHLGETQAQLQQAKEDWQRTTMEQFETVAAYQEGRSLIKEVEHLRTMIQDYRSECAGSQQVLAQYEAQLLGKLPVDVEALSAKLQGVSEEGKRVALLEQQIHQRLQHNGEIDQALRLQQAKMADLEEKYGLTKRLDKLANGDNDWRMSFETFVLITYFTQVLAQANNRLQKMTEGRYFFLRQMEAGDKRRAAGLDIDIMDNYTGKARNVSSLSGGESFKASLALALGLSDVVQSSAGGIELNTIFIDEGFGTLDPDSLEATLDCLLALQDNGRLVGLISHVAELKERIPAWLVVEAGEKGSKAYFKKN